jgi:hypothetical protein
MAREARKALRTRESAGSRVCRSTVENGDDWEMSENRCCLRRVENWLKDARETDFRYGVFRAHPSFANRHSFPPSLRARDRRLHAGRATERFKMLRTRHHYFVSRLVDGLALGAAEAKAAVRAALPKINEFLGGDPAPAHILAYRQPRDTKTEVRRGRVGGMDARRLVAGCGTRRLERGSAVIDTLQRHYAACCSAARPTRTHI